MFGADQLNIPISYQIIGIQWRLHSGGTTWPLVDAVWNIYDVYMGNSVNRPGSLSTNIAANCAAGTRKAARTGPMTAPAGAFRTGRPVHPFGCYIEFASPYVYNGEDLLLDATHTGNLSGTTAFCDNATTFGNGVHSGYAVGSNATTLQYTYAGPLVTKLTHVVPEPATWGLLSLALLALRRR